MQQRFSSHRARCIAALLAATVTLSSIVYPAHRALAAVDTGSGAVEVGAAEAQRAAAASTVSAAAAAALTEGALAAGTCIGAAAAPAINLAGILKGGIPVSDVTVALIGAQTCIQQSLDTATGFVNMAANTISAVQNSATAGYTGALTRKTVLYDPIATAIVKTVINLVRDMVLRWIVTGRFEAPVFSGSFAADLQKITENAARTFLGGLTGINFCAPFAVPPQAFISADLNLRLACTFPGDYNGFLLANTGNIVQFWASEQTANDYWNVLVTTLDAKLQTEYRAQSAFAAEYQAGQGFLGIRDPATGKIVTPGTTVGRLVMKQVIDQPIEQGTVADTTQQAIAVIIDTAINVLIEKGLGKAFGP